MQNARDMGGNIDAIDNFFGNLAQSLADHEITEFEFGEITAEIPTPTLMGQARLKALNAGAGSSSEMMVDTTAAEEQKALALAMAKASLASKNIGQLITKISEWQAECENVSMLPHKISQSLCSPKFHSSNRCRPTTKS